jgi:hypothetical protein
MAYALAEMKRKQQSERSRSVAQAPQYGQGIRPASNASLSGAALYSDVGAMIEAEP